jgi:hypothetical protein
MKIIKNNIWKSKDWAALLKLKSQLSAPTMETNADNSLPTLKENTKTQEIPISENLRKKYSRPTLQFHIKHRQRNRLILKEYCSGTAQFVKKTFYILKGHHI